MDISLFEGQIPVVLTKDLTMESFIMGYHAYRIKWTPFDGEVLNCRMEPNNHKDKYAVAVHKEEAVVGHLMLGISGKFAKTIFYFLRADNIHTCTATVTGKPINQGDGMGMKVPCKLIFNGRKEFIDKLEQVIKKL